MGSSPLTRGARRTVAVAALVEGLIPAHAGSTWHNPQGKKHKAAHPRSRGEHSLRARMSVARGAHPRSRGEHLTFSFCAALIRGSSPLTRGAPGGGLVVRGGLGLIPAHAGSTTSMNE